jgi:hypothetical protein
MTSTTSGSHAPVPEPSASTLSRRGTRTPHNRPARKRLPGTAPPRTRAVTTSASRNTCVFDAPGGFGAETAASSDCPICRPKTPTSITCHRADFRYGRRGECDDAQATPDGRLRRAEGITVTLLRWPRDPRFNGTATGRPRVMPILTRDNFPHALPPHASHRRDSSRAGRPGRGIRPGPDHSPGPRRDGGDSPRASCRRMVGRYPWHGRTQHGRRCHL